MDYRLYLVTDRCLAKGRPLGEIVEQAVKGGVTCVQVREKECSTREFIEQALSIKKILSAKGIPLIINDRIDVALAVGAEAVHLGQADMPIQTARKILPRRMRIGISAENLDQAVEAEKDGADYIGLGPIFPTSTKSDAAPPIGIDGLTAVRRAVGIPIVAIGGINRNNARDIIKNGADGIAVVSFIVTADNPEKAAYELSQKIDYGNTDKN